MRIALGISAAAVGITLLASSLSAETAAAPLNGITRVGPVIGESGNLFYPVLVQSVTGEIHKCQRRTSEIRGQTVRFCAGTGGWKALREASRPVVATSE